MDKEYVLAVQYIHSLLAFGMNPGLQRISALLSSFNEPQRSLRFIHIAGTNGKGSVTTALASICRAAGYKTGHYVSPYVLDFRERIQVNGQMIEKAALARLTKKVRMQSEKLAKQGVVITEFEFITAVGFLYFLEKGCDVVILETGLGGRFDATNVIPPPLCAVITSIALDHCGVLGNTLQQIAMEKCGILKPGSPVVTVPDQPAEALAVIRKTALERSCPLTVPPMPEPVAADIMGTRFLWQGREYFLPLPGQHQMQNMAAVLATVDVLREKGLAVSREAVRRGLSEVWLPGRCEVLSKEPLVLLDGGHNPAGAKALTESLPPALKGSFTAVLGMLADKDVDGCLSYIGPWCKKIITVPVPNPRSMEPSALAALAGKYCSAVTAESSLDKALQTALFCGGPALLCGSLYLCGVLRPKAVQILQNRQTNP